MKIRSLGEFEDAVNRETAWRKRELTTILFHVQESRDSRRPTALRAGVALLYAHWEGWIKKVSEFYIAFIDGQRLQYDELNEAVFGLAIKRRIDPLVSSSAPKLHREFAFFIRNELGSRATFGSGRTIHTESNLSSTVLTRILLSLGLEFKNYEPSSHLIDHRLLHKRNRVAHGEYLDFSIREFEALHGEVVNLLKTFTTEVLNNAALGAYRA